MNRTGGLSDGLIEPRLLAVMNELELSARRLVAEAADGLHLSRRSGLAREFSQYRAYQPGDDPRFIDWKLFARSDRYFLRESEVETRVAVNLILDATESMRHVGDDDAPSKFEVGRRLAAAFAWRAETQGDAAALHLVQDGAVTSIVTAGRRQPFRRILHALAHVQPRGRWCEEPAKLARALRRTDRPGSSIGRDTTADLTVVLTDGHERGEEIRRALAPLRSQRHEVLFLHLRARDEVTFPYAGPTRFVEWETGRIIETDAQRVRAAFLAAEQKEQRAWREMWGRDGFEYLEVVTDDLLAKTVRAYLKRRAAR